MIIVLLGFYDTYNILLHTYYIPFQADFVVFLVDEIWLLCFIIF